MKLIIGNVKKRNNLQQWKDAILRCVSTAHKIHNCVLIFSIALNTARAFQKRSRSQQLTLCRSLHATASEGLAQGPYLAAIDLNLRPSGRRASILPMRHPTPQLFKI